MITASSMEHSCTGSKQKQHGGGQQQQQQQEGPKRRTVTVKVYEELPPGAADRRRRPVERPKPQPPSHGYDRKQMLLAYSQQLRQAHAQQRRSGTEVPKAKWGKWKAAFACSRHSMRNISLQSKLQLWIRRLLGRRSRGRRCRYYQITTGAEDSRWCCDHINSTLAWIKRRWTRAMRRVSQAWRCCHKETDGCCRHELCS